MECIHLLLLLKSNLFLCLCVLESLTLDKSKLYFVDMKPSNNCFIANVNVYRFSNLIKTDNYFRTNCCIVINLKQFRNLKKKYHMTYSIFFYLILYFTSTIFQLNTDGSSWVEPVLSYDKCVLLKDHNAVTLVRLEPAALQSRVKHSTTELLRSLTYNIRY